MTPREIYQAYLDEVSGNLWDGDGAGVARKLKYPHTIHLPEAERIISDPEAQTRDAAAFRESLAALRATAFHRLCRDARFDPDRPDRIVGSHTTYIIRGGSYMTEPYDCAMSLIWDEAQGWLADVIRVSVQNNGMAYYQSENGQNRPFSLKKDD